MNQELLAWTAGLSVGAAGGALLWLVIDATTPDTSGIGLGVSVGLSLGIAHIWTTSVKKRREWRAGEAAALSR